MKNQFKDIKELITEGIIEIKELIIEEPESTHYEYVREAYELAFSFINSREVYYLKKYNNDENKMDEFILNKVIEELEVFSNTTFKIIPFNFSSDEVKINTMKKTLSSLWNQLN